MLKEVQDLRRSIRYSSIATMFISVTLMLAIISLTTIIILMLLLEEPSHPAETEESAPIIDPCPRKQPPYQSSSPS